MLRGSHMNVSLTRVADAEGALIVRNMFTAYFYDLSQYDDNLVINRFGLPTWAPSGLPGPKDHDSCARHNWWVRGSAEAYVIRADGNPAGFLHIMRDRRHLAMGVDQDLLDFYVAPKYRRCGVGSSAARQAFDLYPGTWQVFELARNEPALRFWHKVIGEYTGGDFLDLDDGTQQRFTRR
jgi:predicted acetyltransferase